MAATSSGLTYFGPVFNALSGLDGRQLPSAWHLLYAYATNDIIFACANYNAQAVAQVPLRLYTNRKQQTFESRGVSRAAKAFLAGHGNTRITKALRESEEVEEITEHPLLDLLAQDNDGLNGYKFLLLTQTYLEVVGRAYWGKDRIGLRGVSAFEMYPPQRTMPVRNGVGDVLSFKTMPVLQGQWEDLDKDDVIDFCNVSLDDPWGWGHSPAAACYRKGLLTGKFTQWMNDIVDNRARIDGVFVPADDIGSEMAGKAEAEFKQRFGGGGRGGVWFSPTKGTFVPTTYTPTELGPIEYDKNAVSAICRAFGIPEPLIAANESTYANMEQAKRWHGENTIRSRLLLLEQRLNDLLIPEFDERLFLAFDNPVAEDKEFDLQRKTFAAGQRAMTLNEIREAGGLPPSGDAAHDELPEEPEEEPEETTKDEGEDTRKAITDAVLRINKAVFAGELTTAAGIAALSVAHAIPEEQARGLVVHVEKAEPPKAPEPPTLRKAIPGSAPADYDTLTEPLRQYFREQAEAEKAALAAKEDADAKAKRRAERTALLALLLLGFWRHWAAEAQTATLETIGGTATGNAEALASQTQARADFWAERINHTTFGRLDNALAGAETDEDKQQAIDAVLAEASDKRAPAIAEDQAYKAALLGQRLAAVASGVVVSKMWIAYPGACPVCEKMDGNTVALDQPFVTLLGPMDEPGSVHPSCRCTMLLLTDAGEVIQPRAT